MCDYSLQNVRSRPAKVGDELVTRDFGTGTRGFAAADNREVVVCVMKFHRLHVGAITGACLAVMARANVQSVEQPGVAKIAKSDHCATKAAYLNMKGSMGCL